MFASGCHGMGRFLDPNAYYTSFCRHLHVEALTPIQIAYMASIIHV